MTEVMANPSQTATHDEVEQSAHAAPVEARVDPLAVQQGSLCRRCWQVAPPGDPDRCPTCGAPRPADGWAGMPFDLNDRYRFHKLLGRGAMGAVFVAADRSAPADASGHALARAVKVGQRVDEATLAVQKERFEHEAAAAALLGRSPAYVRTFGYDTGHEPYLVMELVKWPTLAKVLRAGQLSSIQAARLGVALLEALEIMHFYRMVHRDLKPSNMFVDERDGVWRVKIADLGIWIRDHDARAPDSMKTDDRIIHGTPPYMSPEQMAGNTTVGKRSDLHTVGSILWQCVVGEVPFPAAGPTPLEAVRRRQGAVRAPLDRPEAMSPALFAALAKALAPTPGERYRHCRAMIGALRAVVQQGQSGQGWIEGALDELAALRARLEGVDRGRLRPNMKARASSIERGLDMLTEYLERPGAGHYSARRLLRTVRRDLISVVEAADDPYQQAAAKDPTAHSPAPDPPTPEPAAEPQGPAVRLPPTASMMAAVTAPPADADPDATDPDAMLDLDSIDGLDDLPREPLPPTAPVGTQPPPADPIEPYTVVEMIGAGSTARIFEATQTALDRTVALRVMHPEGVSRLGFEDGTDFFHSRARAAGRMWHPNIARIYDYGVGADGLPYVAGALLKGPSLLERQKKERVLDPPVAIDIARQLASALASAHAAGVVHLNLKSHRIILQDRPGLPPLPVIFGFGFARADLDRLLGGGRRYGTPAYMAPEQFESRYGPAADVYALGTVIFRMVTGLLPFWGQTMGQLIEAKKGGAPDLPAKNARQTPVPDGLRAVVAEMLRADPYARPDAAKVARALGRL